jgi:hypothetical protein
MIRCKVSPFEVQNGCSATNLYSGLELRIHYFYACVIPELLVV